VSIFLLAQRPWVRLLGALYPLCTLLVIVGTANHFIIDAIGGLAVFLAGCGVQYLMSGRGAFLKAPQHPRWRVSHPESAREAADPRYTGAAPAADQAEVS
jgi:hypothetical protein